MDKYLEFCNKCIKGKMQYNEDFYVVEPINNECEKNLKKFLDVTESQSGSCGTSRE